MLSSDGKTSKGSQRYRCPHCHQTFSETFDTLYYRRQISSETIQTILQSHAEGSNLRGLSRITGVAYNPCVSVIRSASHKAQMIHNQDVQAVSTDVINADELWSFVKKQKPCDPEELSVGDCWIALSLAKDSGLVLSGRIGKHTDELAQELIENTEGKTACHHWQTDGWEGYSRQLADEVIHQVSKALTQRLERTNGILRQQTGRWHRRQNKFGKVWQQSAVTLRLILTYFNWIWCHSRFKNTAAQRAGLTEHAWEWRDLATYPTLC
ncbi:IS1 family transposase [Acaryochloris sp. CCMEE 5410]|uniref:IS1 family transposase n=1 Tax=Acaryochloris sp. CCMEE 5410 TaxID=310037 RepID=UPI0021CEA9E4|nr:IS1 family transposase [Acaryochloris sp. CCMEE 5410]KAI9135642.1 IS1 family transposase [Acaryochloris sp. CCMEE 5410]